MTNNEEVAKKICTYTCNYVHRDINCHKDCATFKDIMEIAEFKDRELKGYLCEAIEMADQEHCQLLVRKLKDFIKKLGI